MSAGEWEPREGAWRDLQRRGRQHQLQLLRTDRDDGAVLVVAIDPEMTVRLFRGTVEVSHMLDQRDELAIRRAHEATERRL